MKYKLMLVAGLAMALIAPSFSQKTTTESKKSEKPAAKRPVPTRKLIAKSAKITAIEPAGKKAAPARDPKTGKFISKDAAAKKTQARDPKTGRFVSSKTAPKTTPKVTKQAAPKPKVDSKPTLVRYRDPKTGRFISKEEYEKKYGKSVKSKATGADKRAKVEPKNPK